MGFLIWAREVEQQAKGRAGAGRVGRSWLWGGAEWECAYGAELGFLIWDRAGLPNMGRPAGLW